jgi:hypothetical protein
VAIPAFLIVFVAGAMNTLRQTPIYEGASRCSGVSRLAKPREDRADVPGR